MTLCPDDPRRAALERFVRECPPRLELDAASIAPASSDASFRRYFRIRGRDGTWIVMDAPPGLEDCRPFVKVAALLREAGANAPQVVAQDADLGFLLLSDLGRVTYLDAVRRDPARAESLVRDSLAALLRMQRIASVDALPPYDRARLLAELELFPTWYLERHLGHAPTPAEREALDGVFETLLANNLAQPAVFVHRDYHSRNLMALDGGAAAGNPGILDFQDALHGPVTYDLVSLLRDAYIEWDEERQIDWCARYWEQAKRDGLPVQSDFGEFYRDFEWMGLQRHIKVLGIFARLWHRDGKDGYLNDLALVLRHALAVAQRYSAFFPLARLLDAVGQGRAPATDAWPAR